MPLVRRWVRIDSRCFGQSGRHHETTSNIRMPIPRGHSMSTPPRDQDNNQRSSGEWTPPRRADRPRNLEELVRRFGGMTANGQEQGQAPTETVRIAQAPQPQRAQPEHAFLPSRFPAPSTSGRDDTRTPPMTQASTPASSAPSTPRFGPRGGAAPRGHER